MQSLRHPHVRVGAGFKLSCLSSRTGVGIDLLTGTVERNIGIGHLYSRSSIIRYDSHSIKCLLLTALQWTLAKSPILAHL